ncbi:hypothetical protein BH09PLA1_BH09PLA1_04320 [soil metagenome]
MNAKQRNPQTSQARYSLWPETVERRIGLDVQHGMMSVVDDSQDESSGEPSAELVLPMQHIHAQPRHGRGRLRRPANARRRDRFPRRPRRT